MCSLLFSFKFTTTATVAIVTSILTDNSANYDNDGNTDDNSNNKEDLVLDSLVVWGIKSERRSSFDKNRHIFLYNIVES